MIPSFKRNSDSSRLHKSVTTFSYHTSPPPPFTSPQHLSQQNDQMMPQGFTPLPVTPSITPLKQVTGKAGKY